MGGVFEFDGGFAGGFVLGEGAIDRGVDLIGRFDGKDREAVDIAYLEADSWIERFQDKSRRGAVHKTKR